MGRKKPEVIGGKVGDGGYEGFSYATIALRLDAETIPEAEAALSEFIVGVNDLAERSPIVSVIGDTRTTITALAQNLDLARRTLQRETGEQASRN